jgi:hypothetical protein
VSVVRRAGDFDPRHLWRRPTVKGAERHSQGQTTLKEGSMKWMMPGGTTNGGKMETMAMKDAMKKDTMNASRWNARLWGD